MLKDGVLKVACSNKFVFPHGLCIGLYSLKESLKYFLNFLYRRKALPLSAVYLLGMPAGHDHTPHEGASAKVGAGAELDR